ncbi:MAG TPA: MarR family transcriptional regulator [Acidobacteriota bacterium]|nr:MarR family transcriptional regulator [Acidobacteriota bacterium]
MTTLKEELKITANFASLEQEAFLSVLVTSDRINRRNTEFMARFGISPKQFNILRILRGAGKPGIPVMEIGRRMIEKSPDISRIINRLIDVGLVCRRRQRSDRRVVKVSISAKGLRLLEQMDQPVLSHVEEMLSGLTKDELQSVVFLLDRVRESVYRQSPV